ncbi:hypothetical protein FF011L_03790 [Roseimaritima multifibrata]|uniref:Uncharacterized protein n=1 Tax=Roseimaritima multifibrata TaxID=1930274 RepID=A0A517M9T3_9BACT|nr:hypothetical protein FF011L_03790 [Roseimaritima multifibrata]
MANREFAAAAVGCPGCLWVTLNGPLTGKLALVGIAGLIVSQKSPCRARAAELPKWHALDATVRHVRLSALLFFTFCLW